MKVEAFRQPDLGHSVEMLDMIKQMFSEGIPQSRIAERLNKKGYRGALGGKWNSSSVGRLLRQLKLLPTHSSYLEVTKQNAELKARVIELEDTLEHIMKEHYS